MLSSIAQLFFKHNYNEFSFFGVCAKCCGKIFFNLDDNTYTCQRCYEHGGMLDYCFKQMKSENLKDAYEILEAEYEPSSNFIALDQARLLLPNIESIYGEDKISYELPQGFIDPPRGCSKCGGMNFIYILRSTGTVGGRCLRCGSTYPQLPKEGPPSKKNLNRGEHNQQRNWRYNVRKRYSGKCALCDSEDSVEAHHIIPVSVAPEYALSVNNGILLCKKHHNLIHTKPVYTRNK